MTADLVARLRHAIAAKERLARAARDVTGGHWTSRYHEFAGESFWSIDYQEIRGVPYSVVDGGYEGGGVIYEECADHIAANDPDAVLHRCAADRAIVDEVMSWHHHDDDDPWHACRPDPQLGIACTCRLDERRAAILCALADGYGVPRDGG